MNPFFKLKKGCIRGIFIKGTIFFDHKKTNLLLPLIFEKELHLWL